MAWDIVAVNPQWGRIEATGATLLFGFKDEIVVRISPDGNGSRVDARSLWRVGSSDLGTNARRVRRYLQQVISW